MKNWEFYEEELKEYGFAFALVNNQICWCSDVSCSECAFCSFNCNGSKVQWLYQEHKETVVLTDDEKALCKLLGRGWIARDRDEKLFYYILEPYKDCNNWRAEWYIYINKCFPQCKFDFIKWEDEEPWEVKVDD